MTVSRGEMRGMGGYTGEHHDTAMTVNGRLYAARGLDAIDEISTLSMQLSN